MESVKLSAAGAVTLATVSVSIGGWVSQRQKELQTADKTSELYVNPFLDACNDLQGRIYNILMLDGLRPTTAREYARWTLFLIAQYFGRVGLVSRYTHYGQDLDFIEFTERISKAFANHRLWGNTPFRFGRPEQTALGPSAVMLRSGSTGPRSTLSRFTNL